MSERLRAGAYILHSKFSHLVLHDKTVDFGEARRSEVVVHGRDENIFYNKQIWWIEPIPYYEDSNAYTITNIHTGRNLEVIGGSGSDRIYGKLVLSGDLGSIGQRWKIERFIEDDDESIYYSITNVGDGTALDTRPILTEGPHLITSHPDTVYYSQHWQLIKPVVAIPPGWVRILNSSTGHALCHHYNTSPPTLIPPPAQQPPQYRESWGTQCSFIRIQHTCPLNLAASVGWVIKNRLTGGVLHAVEMGDGSWTVGASGKDEYKIHDYWSPEFDEGRGWTIGNEFSYCLLEEGNQSQERVPGNELICRNRRFPKAGDKSWIFHALVEVDDINPVD